MPKQPNVLLIVVDALRAKNLGCYGYSKQVSPNIDNLANDGILFENAFSCAVVTDPSVTTILSGKYPRSHGIFKHGEGVTKRHIGRFLKSGTRLLPEILKSKGYSTLAVDWLGRWHKQGFDYYSGISKQRKTRLLYSLMVESVNRIRPLYSVVRQLLELSKVSLTENAKIITDEATNLIKYVHDKKFFLFVHYWDTHCPYNPPMFYTNRFIDLDNSHNQSVEEILNTFDPKHVKYIRSRLPDGVVNTNEIIARYDGAIAFVDYEIKRLIETLKKHGILDQTFIILTSDHGESLTEHGIYFDHHGLYDTTIHVPLIFKYQGFAEKRRIKSLVQHTDVVPTILDVLRMEFENDGFDGKSAVPLVDNEIRQLHSAIYVEEQDRECKRAIRTSEHKYITACSKESAVCKICGRIHGGVQEFYELRKDPEETQNVIEENPDKAEMLRRELSMWVELFKGIEDRAKKDDQLDKTAYPEEKEIIERLKKLGYI